MDGMKKQAVMMSVEHFFVMWQWRTKLMDRVPNMVIMQYISVFFSGFILSELERPQWEQGKKLTLCSQITIPLNCRLQIPLIQRHHHARP